MNKKEAKKILHETLGNYIDKDSELLALRAITTSVNSLLTWINMLISVGFAIIAVVILGALLEVMVRIANFRSGTQYRTEAILKGLLTSLWHQSVEKTKRKWNSQKSSRASAQKIYQPPVSTHSDISKNGE